MLSRFQSITIQSTHKNIIMNHPDMDHRLDCLQAMAVHREAMTVLHQHTAVLHQEVMVDGKQRLL
jgi:hypothetical protein